jgi:hypothetical protein
MSLASMRCRCWSDNGQKPLMARVAALYIVHAPGTPTVGHVRERSTLSTLSSAHASAASDHPNVWLRQHPRGRSSVLSKQRLRSFMMVECWLPECPR